MKQVTQEELDWFVEGELDQTERDLFFDRLDRDPSGWKRCALALLERDALSQSLVTIRKDDHLELPKPVESILEKEPGKQVTRRTATWLNVAIAASLLGLLFLTGYWAGGNRQDQWSKDRVPYETDPANIGEFRHSKLQRLEDQDLSVVLAINNAVKKIGVTDRELIALVSVDLGSEKRVLPIIESEILNQRFVEMLAPRLPVAWSNKLAKSGYEVQPHPQFLSVHHEDGSNEVLALNLLDCRFVGRPVF